MAFGTSDPIFGERPSPSYEPWYWSGSSFQQVIKPVRRTGVVLAALPDPHARLRRDRDRSICVVVGFLVAYYVARYGGKRKTLYLVLLVAPFWISYLMRIFAWQSLLQPNGYVNDFLMIIHVAPTPIDWLSGQARHGHPLARLRVHPVHDPAHLRRDRSA